MTRHLPVLLKEVIESLNLKSGMNAVDCTLGDGGHSEEILEATGPKGKVLGIDSDSESILRAKKYLYRFDDRVVFVRDNFVNIKRIASENKFEKIDAILMDFGWSSPQFAERGRGFSFQKDEVLDMRYDPSSTKLTAKEIVNSSPEKELEKIFREYGEEKNSKKIANAIVEARKEKEINTTTDLVEIVSQINKGKFQKIHPATRVFQALRIAVNDELGVIKKVLPDAIDILGKGGRLAVITFHSLEDRIIKHFFKSQENKKLKLINKKPITCSGEELKENPRARSAKLRVVEKI
jgi:16S rRNA (cytosine1402-N4)-methyltransferase